ncbi:squalene epoxidase [Ramaria rubella]|nr:squalene epoxidase [Ramaria rubella]
MTESTSYDVIIAFAHALVSRRPSELKPLNILLLERSLSCPSRIVGELLQPRGIAALENLNLSSVLSEIDSFPMRGYCVVQSTDQAAVPYFKLAQGRTFEHGKFVMALRRKAAHSPGVRILEASVESLVECPLTARILGVKTRLIGSDSVTSLYGGLTVIADGCFSRFRHVMGQHSRNTVTMGHFAGIVLRDAVLPMPNHGTVVFIPGGGPVLMYQIGDRSTRMLIDFPGASLPRDVKGYVLSHVVPILPAELQLSVLDAIQQERVKVMPNSVLPASVQGTSKSMEGVVLLGDAWNMRHPLTGAGMTIGFVDIDILSRRLVGIPDLSDWSRVAPSLVGWYWERKPLASTLNILSVALYHLFQNQGYESVILRTGCFSYFKRGEGATKGTVSLLSGLTSNPVSLMYHFFVVAMHGIILRIRQLNGSENAVGSDATCLFNLITTVVVCFQAMKSAVIIISLPTWYEIKWW